LPQTHPVIAINKEYFIYNILLVNLPLLGSIYSFFE